MATRMSSIKDVARLAGVSISTVSRVLNNSCPVSADKRERVEAAARELGYVPNPAARSLLLRKTGVLGVVVPFATGEFFSEFLSGVDQTASDHNYFLLISISHRSDQDLRTAVANLNKRVDGLLVWAPEVRASDVKSLVSHDLPMVFLNSLSHSNGDDLIDFDNYGGMYALASLLIRQGHRDIAFLTGDETDWRAAGLRMVETPDDPPDEDCIDYLFFVHDRHAGNLDACRAYLAWETGLIAQMDEQEKSAFRIAG